MNRKSIRSRVPSIRPEWLEPRGLLAVGLLGGLNTVMDLGEVSRALATKGVEVSATIPSHGSITFEFSAATAGNYLLEVRHAGDGLTLEATGPAGSASVNPGPAGPFKTIALPLKAADYEIKASATGDQPVFVDWELLLTSGVGQSAAIGSTIVAPSVALPLATNPGPVVLSASALPSPSSPPPASTASMSWSAAVSPSMIATGGPVGRSEPNEAITPVGPTSPDGSLALAYAGDAIPAGALMALESVAAQGTASTAIDPSSSPTSLLTLSVLGDDRLDLAALGAPTWLDQLAGVPDATTSEPKSEPIEAAAVGDPIDQQPSGGTIMASSPNLIVTGVIVASALHRWRPGCLRLKKRPHSPTRSEILPPSRA